MTTSEFIPHLKIRIQQDRAWSLRLVHEVLNGSLEETDFEAITESLVALDDWRTIGPLMTLVLDQTAEHWRREIASDILCACTTFESPAERWNWWRTGDQILMRQAILCSDRSDTALIEQVAADPQHPNYVDAIDRLSMGFQERKYLDLKRNALNHPDAEVRELAVLALQSDLPVSAIPQLLHIAEHDIEDTVIEATNQLSYHYSIGVWLELRRMQGRAEDDLQHVFESAGETIRSRFVSEARMLKSSNPSALGLLKDWMLPIWDLVYDEVSAEWTEHKPAEWQIPADPISAIAVQEYFNDQNGEKSSAGNVILGMTISSYTEDEQAALARYFSQHPDWSAREWSCRPLANWSAGAAVLLKFLDDPVSKVRFAAVRAANKLQPDTLIASRLLSMLIDENLDAYCACETLESYAAHAHTDPELDTLLLKFASTDERESLCITAVGLLCSRGRRDLIAALIPRLLEKPLVTWDLHKAIIDSCLKLGLVLPTSMDLTKIDDLPFQCSLSQLLAAQQLS